MNDKNDGFVGLFEGLAERTESVDTVNGFFALLPKLSKGVLIRQYEIFHKVNLVSVINKEIEENKSFHKVFLSSPLFFGFYVSQSRNDNSEKGYFGVIPGDTPNISRIITISRSDFWNRIVRRLVKKIYPDAMPIFFRQGEIEQALNKLENGLGYRYRIRIADVTAKEETNRSSSFSSRKYDTQRWWTDLPVADVFSQAKERGQWFSGLRFTIQRRIGDTERFNPCGSGRIYKFGEMNYDSFYSEINSLLINYLEQIAHQRLSTLDGRGMRERGYRPAQPIELSFDYDIFSELEEVRRFGRVVSEYPNATKAVYHANPYYHATVADFLDGSSFEVWVLSTNKVVLLPQAKSSAQAFERFIGHISANFGEGAVNEYQG